MTVLMTKGTTVRVVLTASLLAAAALPASAADVPPNVVGSIGTISPGLSAEPQDQHVEIDGTPWIVGRQWCHLSGDGFGDAASMVGTLSGNCGTTTYTDCTFALTPSTLTIACADAAGAFAVRYLNTLPTTVFAADGALT